MLCPQCGKRLKAGSAFCSNCGMRLGTGHGNRLAPAPAAVSRARKKRSAAWIAGIVCAVVALGTVAALMITTPYSDSASLSNEMLPGFVFDEPDVVTVAGVPVPEPVVSGISPAAGIVGTKIQITGSNLTGAGLMTAKLGETEMNMLDVSDDAIEAYLPFGAETGNISLVYADRTIDAGLFEVLPQEKELLVEQSVSPGADAQTVAAGEISLTLPGNVLDKEQTVRIERIAKVKPINLPESATGTAFSITVGDIRQFNDTLTVDFKLPADLPGEPSAAYFNETNSMWYTLPSEVVDGQLKIYTDHLTDLFIFYWGKAIYSPDGYFKIFYEEDDKFPQAIASNMDELAKKIGVALEEARKDYSGEGAAAGTKVLSDAFREDFSYLGFKDAMDVYVQSNINEPTYNATTNNILINTSLHNQKDIEITTAHELFHAYQDYYLNEFGALFYSSNLWAIEATAELAAYELAYPEKNREREIVFRSTSQNRWDTIVPGNEQAYDMACFLKYLLDKTNSDFVDMWESVASHSSLTMSDGMNDFFESQSDDFYGLNHAYLDFWRDVTGDKDAPFMVYIQNLFDGRTIELAYNQHEASFTYTPDKAATTAFGMFRAASFQENMPVRVFNVECTSASASCTKVSNVVYKGKYILNFLNNARVSGGHDWRPVYQSHDAIASHRLYSLEQGKNEMLLIALEAINEGKTHSVQISEIQAQCLPKKIEDVIPGMEQAFKVQFKDIFKYVKDMELIVDFGDGTGKRFTKVNENGLLGGKLKHTFGDKITGDAVTFSLYDVSGGEKQLISQLKIPIAKGRPVTLSASPNPAQAGEAVGLQANITDAGYTYQWNFGDGETDATYGTSTSHIYDQPGSYTATVTVIDLDNAKIGTATTTVKVTEAAVTPSPGPVGTPQPSTTATVSPAETETNQMTYPIDTMVFDDLKGVWKGTAVLTGITNAEKLTFNGEALSDDEVTALYNAVGKESEFTIEFDPAMDGFVSHLRLDVPKHGWFADFANEATLSNGVLTALDEVPDWHRYEYHAILSQDTDGRLMLQGTLDAMEHETDLDDVNKSHKVSRSLTFTVKWVP